MENDIFLNDSVEAVPSVEKLPSLPPRQSLKEIKFFIIAAAVVVFLAAVGTISAAVYLLPISDSFVRSVTSVVPYPVAVVNAEPITFKEFYLEWDAMQSYLSSSQIDSASIPPIGELQGNIVDSMVNKTVVRQLAKQYGLTLSQEKVDETTQKIFSQYDSEQAALDAVQQTFGWNKQVFVDRVIKPVVLSSQLEETVYADESLQIEAKTKINDALQRLKNSEAFAKVAAEVSSDSSATNGGDIGFRTVGAVPAEWVAAVDSLGLNQFSDVVDLASVYSISMASEKTESAEDGSQYHFHIIIVNKYSLDEVLKNFMSASKIWRLFKAV